MFRLIAAATVAMATAQDMPGLETKDGNLIFIAPNKVSFVKPVVEMVEENVLIADTEKLDSLVQEQNANVDDIVAVGDITERSASRIADAGSKTAAVKKQSDAIVAGIDANAEKVAEVVAEGGAAHLDTLNTEVASMQASLDNAFNVLKATLSEQQAELVDNYQAKLDEANNVAASLSESADTINSDIAKYEECSDRGMLYRSDTGKCGDPKIDAEKVLNKVYHRMFKNDDGRDSGYVNERYVQFKKFNDDTYMRIFYYDNFRVHGHHAHAMWNVMICDANGNGCDHCSEPGRLHNWRWSAHQSNWWMLDHVGQTVTGLCKKGGGRDLRKGTYQLKVYIDQNYYDMYTGSNTQQSNFMVDEVMKY